MRIALVTDAWTPQVNGVVRTLSTTVAKLRALGHVVETVTPDQFKTLPCPSYPEIRLALGAGAGIARRLGLFAPDALHIATEGPLGWAARRWALAEGMPFTTSFHTRFPDYLALRTRLPADLFWPLVRRFHAPAARVFAATATLEAELQSRGLARTHRWSRGVDLSQFTPIGAKHPALAEVAGPVLLHVGRVAVEKNIGAFLALDRPGTKVVVGDGPALAVERAADLLVFPSRTDTFGLVMVEAMACGVPVAAYPVPGPLDVIGDLPVGALDTDLGRAVDRALLLDRAACVAVGRGYDWSVCTGQFLAGLAPRARHAVAA